MSLKNIRHKMVIPLYLKELNVSLEGQIIILVDFAFDDSFFLKSSKNIRHKTAFFLYLKESNYSLNDENILSLI